jgi:hypothetical protein
MLCIPALLFYFGAYSWFSAKRMCFMKINKLFGAVVVFGLLTACQGKTQAATPEISTSVPFVVITSVPAEVGTPLIDLQETTLTPPIVPSADLVFTSSQGSANIQVGQSFFIVVPGSSPEWDVTYDDVLLEALLPPDVSRPGDEKGWLFRAKAVGKTTLTFVSRLPVCDSRHPCPAMPTYDFSINLSILP